MLEYESLREEANFCFSQDLNLPKSIITRLAKGTLPPNTQIQGNAILALSKSATVFISYLASQYVLPHETLHVIYFGGFGPPSSLIHEEQNRSYMYTLAKKLITLMHHSANENTVAAGKKTISPADVFKALDDTEFSFLKESLEAEFASMSSRTHSPRPSDMASIFFFFQFLFIL